MRRPSDQRVTWETWDTFLHRDHAERLVLRMEVHFDMYEFRVHAEIPPEGSEMNMVQI